VPARIGRRVFVDARYVAAAHALGLPVHAWTVNDRAEMTRLLDLGVDGIMTDRADTLRDLLISRGQWQG
jgi:glycerophosphoryl diester phosphodiesterase